MILVTHAVGGAAAALLVTSHPVTAFAVGFVSHFLLDAIPHWHYPTPSFVRNKDKVTIRDPGYFMWGSPLFILDAIKVAIDCLIGIAIAVTAAHYADAGPFGVVLAGAIGGVLPDFLQLAYHVFPRSPLKYFLWFHHWVHTNRRFDSEPLIGISSQLAIFIALLFLLVY